MSKLRDDLYLAMGPMTQPMTMDNVEEVVKGHLKAYKEDRHAMFAAAAMQGLISDGVLAHTGLPEKDISLTVFIAKHMADAMMGLYDENN